MLDKSLRAGGAAETLTACLGHTHTQRHKLCLGHAHVFADNWLLKTYDRVVHIKFLYMVIIPCDIMPTPSDHNLKQRSR